MNLLFTQLPEAMQELLFYVYWLKCAEMLLGPVAHHRSGTRAPYPGIDLIFLQIRFRDDE